MPIPEEMRNPDWWNRQAEDKEFDTLADLEVIKESIDRVIRSMDLQTNIETAMPNGSDEPATTPRRPSSGPGPL